MPRLVRVPVLAALAILMPVIALARAPDDSAEGDYRQVLEKIRVSDPERYARLKHNFAVFRALPPERQEALRKLDRDLQEEITSMRSRLERAAERYADWLDRLSEADRRSVTAAPDRKTRLQRIRAIREAQWLQRLPRATAEKIAKTPEAQRGDLIRKLQNDELEERLDWIVAQRHWDQFLRPSGSLPTRPDHLPEDARETLEKSLRPLLNPQQEQRLKEAEGKWPRYPRVLVELADNHPISVLGPIGPTTIKELQINPFVQQFLEKNKKLWDRLKEAEGKWPEFGVAVREVSRLPMPFGKGGRIMGPLPNKFTPARAQDFPPMIQQFIEKKLVPALDPDETFLLKKTEGEWPAYPRLVVDLARKHNLQVPAPPSRFDTMERYRWRSLTGGKGGRD